MAGSKSLRKFVLVSLLLQVSLTGCNREHPHYVFVLPDEYVGWIQVVFDSPDAPSVEPDHGKFVLRIDETGVFKTRSLKYIFAGAHDEFFYRKLGSNGKEVLFPVPSNYYCAGASGIDSCLGSEGSKTDSFSVSRARLGSRNELTPGNSWFLFVGPQSIREKMAKPIHRAPGEKYQIDVPEDDPRPGMLPKS
jgi:hypothetical protein